MKYESRPHADLKSGYVLQMFPPPYARSPAARMALVMDLLEPADEDGVRHPEWALISREEAVRLLDQAVEFG